MDVARREKFSLTCCDPAFPSRGLTLWAMPISAGVVRDGGPMPAAGAVIEMTAECGGATGRNGLQRLAGSPVDPLATLFHECACPVAAETCDSAGPRRC